MAFPTEGPAVGALPKPRVSLCMIVKNEEENLPGCLESVRGLVDEIVVVDTGSEDGTIRMAESFGASVHHMPWQGNFAAARNESLRHAGGDWIFYLDADERLDCSGAADCIRNVAASPDVDAWSVPIRSYKYGSDSYDTGVNIRLFRNLPEIRFENEVHERVEPSLARMGAHIAVAPFFIHHFGYRLEPEAAKKKLERNLLLSRKHLEHAPDDPYCLYYMGLTHLLLEEKGESRRYFERGLDAPALPLFLQAMFYNLVAYLDLLEGRFDEALTNSERSRELVPRQNTCMLVRGVALFSKSDFAGALPCLLEARRFLQLPIGERRTDLSQEFALIDDVEFDRLVGVCYSEINRPEQAVPLFRRYLEKRGKEPQILKRLGVCCVNSGDYSAGLEYLEEAEALGIALSEIALPMAFACIRTNRQGRAQELLESAKAHSQQEEEKLDRMKKLLESENSKKGACRPGTAGPKVSLCMIVKNEEKNLAGCLESVRSLVDEMIVVDTGSSDKTLEVARSCGARVFSFPWNEDFSAARNECLRHAHGDWVLVLDADERVNPLGLHDCLRESAAAATVDAFYIPILNAGTDTDEEKKDCTLGRVIRFFRNLPGIRFSGRVHENLDRFLLKYGARAGHGDFIIEHHGYSEDRRVVTRKYERNRALLEKELAENPRDAVALYHLGLTYMALEREEEARPVFDRALTGQDLNPGLEAMILNMKSYHHLRAGELDESFESASRSLGLVPVQNTAGLLKGLVLFQKRSFGEALPLLLQSYRFLSLPPQERKSDISWEDSIEKSELIDLLGTCFMEVGRFEESTPFLKFTAHRKQDSAAYERLGICLLNTGDFRGAAEYLEKARAGAQNPDAVALPLSFACFRTGDFPRAVKYFCLSVPKDASEAAVTLQLIQAMADDGNFRPYLASCIQSKRDFFRETFPAEFAGLLARIGQFGRPGENSRP